MTDELDFEGLFQGLPPEQAREIAGAMVQAARQKLTDIRNPQPQDPYAAQEEAELEKLRNSGIRGGNFALQKQGILAKYAQLRKEANRQPVIDPEIEKVKNDPKALRSLYNTRKAAIMKNTKQAHATKLHQVSDLRGMFRQAGLSEGDL